MNSLPANGDVGFILNHLDKKLDELKCRRNPELIQLMIELKALWSFFDRCREIDQELTSAAKVSNSTGKAFHQAAVEAKTTLKHLKTVLSIVQAGSHRDHSSLINCLAASLGIIDKETPKRIPTPHHYVVIAVYQLLVPADLDKIAWPSLSDIRVEAQKLLRAKFKNGDHAKLTDGQWREAREYFELKKFFRSEEYGGGARPENRGKNRLLKRKK